MRWNGTAWEVQARPNLGHHNWLGAVTATSSTNAWAVGYQGSNRYRTLVERWNGTAWKAQKTPGHGILSGVAATSATNAWAVGSFQEILYWNGTAGRIQNPPSHGVLAGVAATSRANAWAVGRSFKGKTTRTLALHWNGTAWKG